MSEWFCAWCGGVSSMMGHYSAGHYFNGRWHSMPSGAHTCSPEYTRLLVQTFGQEEADAFRTRVPERKRNELAPE